MFENDKTVPNACPADAPDFIRDYHDFYCTPRGFHPRSVNSGLGWQATGIYSYNSFSLFDYAEEIESAVLLVHGEKAYSRYASEKVMKLLKGDNKELLIIPGASHCDLYDGGKDKVIPFDKIENFFNANLK